MQTINYKLISNLLPWLLGTVVVAVPLYAFFSAQRDPSNLYELFPVLGILAWSLMWTHYANGSLTMLLPKLERNALYKKVTEYAVLGLILAHPFLFIYARYRDTGLIPPASYVGYVGEANVVYILMGTLGLMIFLSYEVFSRLREHPKVSSNWRWVSISQILAMVLIFIHSLSLGTLLATEWFQTWWIILAMLLLPCFYLTLKHDWRKKEA